MSKAKCSIVPLADRVVVTPLSGEGTKTASGIIIPDTVSKEKPEQGIVVAVGEGRQLDDGSRLPMSVKEGDTVLFTKYGPDEVTVDGKEYFILGESNILAIIT